MIDIKTVDKITSEVDLFAPILQQTVLLNAHRAYLSTLINFSEETQKTRLLCKGWTKDTSGHMGVTDVTGDNQGLRTRAAQFAPSRVVELIGRPPAYSTKLRCVPETNSFCQQFCLQVNRSSERATAKLRSTDPVCLADHSHEAAHQRRGESAQRAPQKNKSCVCRTLASR